MNNKHAPITERIYDEITQSKKDIFLNADTNKKSYKKSSGNMVASIFRKHIINILNYYGYEFRVSNVNAYIKGYPTEWDLIILNSNAVDHNNNVYDVNDVKAVLEFKANGLYVIHKEYDDFFKEEFDSRFNILNSINSIYKNRIPFGYITYKEQPKLYEATKKYFDEKNNKNDTTFVFINSNKYNNDKDISYDKCCFDLNNNFEEYLFKLLGL